MRPLTLPPNTSMSVNQWAEGWGSLFISLLVEFLYLWHTSVTMLSVFLFAKVSLIKMVDFERKTARLQIDVGHTCIHILTSFQKRTILHVVLYPCGYGFHFNCNQKLQMKSLLLLIILKKFTIFTWFLIFPNDRDKLSAE